MKDECLLKLMKKDGRKAISLLFEKHYRLMCRVAIRIVGEQNAAEDIAQEVFTNLWKKRDSLEIKTAPAAYLRTAVRNRSINYLKRRRYNFTPKGEEMQITCSQSCAQKKMEAEDLQNRIQIAINNLPEKARISFCLNRFDNMTYSEIANELDISVKTVEYRVSKALSLLRTSLMHE